MSFEIREVRVSDAETAAALLNSVIEEARYTIVVKPFTVDEMFEFIRKTLANGTFFIAIAEDDQVLGLQLMLPYSTMASLKHVGDIGTYVAPLSHRSGVGRALSEATFKKAREQGFLKVIAMIRGDNPRAQAFYNSLGFRLIGTALKHAYVRGEYIDEVLMERFL
jgi:L-amino acid N-acyltransferase YncA